MAKTYIDTVKYNIFADVEIDGMVDRPDVVGAIFGQTEGLLGGELDLRDLQKNGRIGRIEVDLKSRGGKTRGYVKIPSSLDMVETCIIGAAVETVERVGPCEARIKISRVEDTRKIKRDKLVERSKFLLRNLIHTEIPESQEISDMVREEVKSAEITTWGRDKLASGPGIAKHESIILVEGRADVVNLLKKDLPNVVAIGGAKVPPSLLDISKAKEITLFLDGDRGGDIILKELVSAGVDVDFVARAPVGKEVEELTRKEMMKCLKNKLPFEGGEKDTAKHSYKVRGAEEMVKKYEPPTQTAVAVERPSLPIDEIGSGKEEKGPAKSEPAGKPPGKEEPREKKEAPKKEERQGTDTAGVRLEPKGRQTGALEAKGPAEPREEHAKMIRSKADLMDELSELKGTLKARFYDGKYKLIKELPVREVIKSLEEIPGTKVIVFDGIITQRLVDLAQNKGVELLVGEKLGNVNKKPEKIELVTKSK